MGLPCLLQWIGTSGISQGPQDRREPPKTAPISNGGIEASLHWFFICLQIFHKRLFQVALYLESINMLATSGFLICVLHCMISHIHFYLYPSHVLLWRKDRERGLKRTKGCKDKKQRGEIMHSVLAGWGSMASQQRTIDPGTHKEHHRSELVTCRDQPHQLGVSCVSDSPCCSHGRGQGYRKKNHLTQAWHRELLMIRQLILWTLWKFQRHPTHFWSRVFVTNVQARRLLLISAKHSVLLWNMKDQEFKKCSLKFFETNPAI